MKKQSTEEYYKFCSIILMLSKKTYQKLLSFLPLLSMSSVYAYLQAPKIYLNKLIQNSVYIQILLSKVYEKFIKFESGKAVAPIYINLGGDEASLKSSSKAIYVFEILPLFKHFPPCVVNTMPTTNGSSPQSVVDRFKELTNLLKDLNFIVKFCSTDGDISFDFKHRNFFTEKVEPLINESFEMIVFSLRNEIAIPISDILHLLKSARSRLIEHLLLIDPDSLKCVNTSLFASCAELNAEFTDKSSSGAMKDAYPLSMFSWRSFVNLMMNGRYESAYYILPFLYLIEAIRSNLLSKTTKLNFLNYAFNIFKKHLEIIRNVDKNSMFKQRYTSKCLGVLFADEIFLMRIMNTIVGLAIAIRFFPEDLALQRIGTHDLELFFGNMRLLCFYDNSYDNSIRVICETILIRQFCKDLDIPILINKRVNESGIVLTCEINNLEDLAFDGTKLTETVYNLMLDNEVKDIDLHECEIMINNYSNKIMNSQSYMKVKIPNLLTGTLAYHRYRNIQYSLSVLPIDHEKSVFQYYCDDLKFKKKNR
ncbi:hypothetical protein M9Y10_013748 [Tritrichomonas musculus]|uniref:Uncharacterized protein n=1 Tax=Tritrichomonas musculus TaxID=1915356 RepID=A0ABR2KZM0_9EUKA